LLLRKGAELEDVVRPGSARALADVLPTPAERQAAEILLRSGYPRQALGAIGFLQLGPTMMDFIEFQVDPTYFEDFWKLPG